MLPDLLRELDASPARARLTALVEGVLAANIFDWGAQACVDLYQNGTILEIYRRAPRSRLPWHAKSAHCCEPARTLPVLPHAPACEMGCN